MNDKMKGLILGALLGSAITGSAAYASGAEIEVLFRPVKFLFDGVEKQPTEGTAFIYQDSTYVPLRFVSETLGKEVGWDEETGTISIDEPGTKKVIAEYKDQSAVYSITQGRLNKQLAISQLYNPSNKAYLEDQGFIEQSVQKLALYMLASGRVNSSVLETALTKAPVLLEELKTSFAQAFQGKLEWDNRLKELKLSDQDILEHLRLDYIQNQYLKSLITDDRLRLSYGESVKSHDLDTATVRHVLIGFNMEDGKTRTKEEAMNRAKEALTKLRAGSDFGEIALAYSDDPGSKETGGRYENAPIVKWVTGFKEAVQSQPIGQIGEPVETDFGYHIILVESRKTPSFDDARDQLTNSLQASDYQQLLEVELPKLQTSQH